MIIIIYNNIYKISGGGDDNDVDNNDGNA